MIPGRSGGKILAVSARSPSRIAPVLGRMRKKLAHAPGFALVVAAFDRRRLHRLAAEEAPGDRSRRRWQQAEPNVALTWGAPLAGGPAVAASAKHGVFGPGQAILEIGPGYGRILDAALGSGVQFERYVGLDISRQNIRHLNARFDDPRITFIQGDVESFSLDDPVDAVHSYLTFKHLYPTFVPGLTNIAAGLRPGGVAVFDLIEGSRFHFERDEVTYIREYRRDEIGPLIREAGLEPLAIDGVVHAPDRERLLVVAGKPG